MEGFTFTWEIENFSMIPHKHGEELKSDTFVIEQWGNMECFLTLYFEEKDGESYISLYLETIAKDLESKHTFSLTLVSTEHSSDDTILFENESLNDGFGIERFWSLDEIHANNKLYLPNDTLTLRCYLKPPGDYSEETTRRNKSESISNFFIQCHSRTVMQLRRRSTKFILRNIKELKKLTDNTSFVVETALTASAGLKITVSVTELSSKDFVKIEIRQTKLLLEKERLFVKCKMTVLSARKKYQDSKESTHVFQSALEETWHFPEFIRISDLTPGKYLYLDDSLLLQCELTFSSKNEVYHLETNYTKVFLGTKEKRNVSELSTNLEDLYSDGEFCDVQLRAAGQTFPVHKVVLCAMSPVFRAMFKIDLKEKDSSVVELEDVDPDTLRRMLTFMYSDILQEDLSFENVRLLFVAADKYDLDTLRRRCLMLLASSLSAANVCDVLVLADAHQDKFLLIAVHNFINSNSYETFNSESWMKFMNLNPKLSGEIMHQMCIKKRLS